MIRRPMAGITIRTRVGVASALALAGALLALPPPAPAAATDWTKLRTLNIAHQGGEDEAPSNTTYALERSLRLGADMLELDVHTSADGHLVVIHDATVDRTTNGSGSVYEMTLAEIQALDAGHNAVPGEGTESGRPAADYPFRGVRLGKRRPPRGFSPDDFRIPTLDEVMRAYPAVPINIEIKGAADTDIGSFLQNAEQLAAFLNSLGRSEGIVVASFNDAALARFHQLAPQIDLAPATAAVAAYKLAFVPPPQGTKVFQIPIEFAGVTVTDEAFVERIHRDGFAAHIWTINDAPTMRQLLGWGVDGIMSAEPMRLERVLCRQGTGRPRRPRSFPGRHCTQRASIACDVRPTRLVLEGRLLGVSLRRADELASLCAGRVGVRVAGSKRRATMRFKFGWRPPSAGGKGKRHVWTGVSRKLARALRRKGGARVSARPYHAFVRRDRLGLR